MGGNATGIILGMLAELEVMRRYEDQETIQREIGQKIQAIRKGAHLTQDQVAAQIKTAERPDGVTRQYVSKIERGEQAISLDQAVKIARTLDCSVVDFLPEDVVKDPGYALLSALLRQLPPEKRRELQAAFEGIIRSAL